MKQYKVKHEIQYHDIIECITCALDARDTYTAGHSKRVSDMALRVCYVLRLKKKEIQKIHIAAHLHDIGKIGVPDVILLKEGRLEPEEWEQMKKAFRDRGRDFEQISPSGRIKKILSFITMNDMMEVDIPQGFKENKFL